LLIILNEVKGFLLLFKIFMGFFVNEIIKDFCWIFACGIFRGFLGIRSQRVFVGFLGHGLTMCQYKNKDTFQAIYQL
jgi:hypothetical protein